MKRRKGYGLRVFLFALIASLAVILFYGNSLSNLSKGKVWGFKAGLDLAGGVRLTYKIDFSQYKEVYTDPIEFERVKKRIETIIQHNIDNRISKLWVSDYNSYIQTLNWEDYLVVEIWGFHDLEAAKRLIGKVVKLEFKLPAEEVDAELIKTRLTRAQTLLNSAINTPDKFAQIGTGQQADAIFYSSLVAPLDWLPQGIQNEIDNIKKVWTGKVYPQLITGELIVSDQGDVLTWWFVVKYNGEQKLSLSGEYLPSVVYKTLSELWVEYTSDFVITGTQYRLWSLISHWNELWYIGQDIPKNIGAYKVKIATIPLPKFQVGGDITKITAAREEIQNKVKSQGWESVYTISGGEVIYPLSGQIGWIDQYTLDKLIGTWKSLSISSTGTYEFIQWDTLIVLDVEAVKPQDQYLYLITKFELPEGVSKDDLIKKLQNAKAYNIEFIFIASRPQRVPAKDPKTWEILNAAYFRFAEYGRNQIGEPVVLVHFDEKGKEIFCNISTKYVNKQMAIAVWGKIVTAPVIREPICWGTAQISWNFWEEEAKKMTQDLNEWAMPAQLILVSEEKISPTLGENALKWALIAGLVAFVLIGIYMIFMYWGAMGWVALASLVLFLAVVLAISKLIGVVFSLSGIAAIVLSIGMAVDANILIFERVREEKAQDKPWFSAIEDWYQRSLSAIRDWNITTFLIWLLLFFIGTNVFKGFGSMLVLNILITLFVLVPITKLLLDDLLASKD